MSASKLSDLLPIPDGVSQPHAYQVFGLVGGERDNQKVSDAMRSTYANLKAAKETTDPSLWKQAAKLAEAARKLLADPERRRELDARFGVNVGEPDSASVLDDDPLAAVLPGADPLSGSLASVGSSPAILGTPPLGGLAGGNEPQIGEASPIPLGTPPLGTPPGTSAATTATTNSSSPVSVAAPEMEVLEGTLVEVPSPQHGWSPQKPSGRRRKKKAGAVLFGGFLLLMFGAIGGLLYFLTTGGNMQIGETPPENGIKVAPPMQERPGEIVSVDDKPDSDGVLGDVAQSGIAPSLRGDGSPIEGSGLSGPPSMPDIEVPPLPNPMESSAMDQAAMVDSATMMSTDSQSTPDPTMAEPSMTEDKIKANDAKIAAVAKQIQAGDWAGMKSAADGLRKLELSPEQVPLAEALYDIADLATFYRGAVVRGLATLEAGATFEFGGLNVVVVEVAGNQLTIRYDRKSKTFTINQLPPRLTEKLAAFSLPSDRPDSIAGLALYRLIRSDTNPEYRADAFEKLATVEGLENVDTVMLLNVAQDLLD